MNTSQKRQPALVLNRAEYDKYVAERGWGKEEQQAAELGLNRGSLNRIRNEKATVGPKFLALLIADAAKNGMRHGEAFERFFTIHVDTATPARDAA